MSSQRGFSPARIAPEAGVLLLTAGLLVAGCSSVAAPDLQADAALTGGTGDTEEFGSTSGGPDDPLTSSGGGTATGASSDGSSAGGTTGAESGGGTVPPEELPEPHDVLHAPARIHGGSGGDRTRRDCADRLSPTGLGLRKDDPLNLVQRNANGAENRADPRNLVGGASAALFSGNR